MKLENVVSTLSALILLGFGITNIIEFDKYRFQTKSLFDACLTNEGEPLPESSQIEFENLSKAGFAFGFLFVFAGFFFATKICSC